MDPALIPHTAPGRQLSWLMTLRAEPSAEEIQDHLDPTAAVDIQVDLRERGTPITDLASGLLALGTMVRDLPGTVSRSEHALLRLELAYGARVLHALVAVDHGGSGRVGLVGLRERPVEDEVESDRVRLLYDRAAEAYEQLGAEQAHYWDRAQAWLQEKTRDGCTLLDVGCGPGHHVADLPPSVRVIGCDISPDMVRLAALARPTGSFVVHDYHQPFPTQWPLADVAVVLGCLEFCSDLTQVARNLAAATKPGGRLLLTVPRAASRTARREITIQPIPFVEIAVHSWEDAEVETAVGAADLDVITHDAGPGWTAPEIGTVEYGFWELKRTSDLQAHDHQVVGRPPVRRAAVLVAPDRREPDLLVHRHDASVIGRLAGGESANVRFDNSFVVYRAIYVTVLSDTAATVQPPVTRRGPRSRISARSAAVAVRCSCSQVHMLHPRWVKPICSS